MNIPLDQLLGPVGLTIALIGAVWLLWREHVRSDADVRAMRDVALDGWREQTAATNRVADALEDGLGIKPEKDLEHKAQRRGPG